QRGVPRRSCPSQHHETNTKQSHSRNQIDAGLNRQACESGRFNRLHVEWSDRIQRLKLSQMRWAVQDTAFLCPFIRMLDYWIHRFDGFMFPPNQCFVDVSVKIVGHGVAKACPRYACDESDIQTCCENAPRAHRLGVIRDRTV